MFQLIGGKRFAGLEKINRTKEAKMMCCMMCYKNPLKSLEACLCATHGFSPSNLVKHLSTMHKNEAVLQQFVTDNVHANGGEEKKSNNRVDGVLQVGSSQHLAATVTNNSSFSNAFGKTKLPQIIIERGNHLMYQFMRSCNIAARHSNSNEMLTFFEHVIENSNFYRSNKSQLMMGFYKYKHQRLRSFGNLVDLIKKMVKRTREWFMEETGCTTMVPFVSVAHNGWDSKDHDMIGVSIHFIDILRKKKRTIAIGLQRLYSKKSVDVAQHVLKILFRYMVSTIPQCVCFKTLIDTILYIINMSFVSKTKNRRSCRLPQHFEREEFN